MKKQKIVKMAVVIVILIALAVVLGIVLSAKIKVVSCKTQFGDCPPEYTNRLAYLIGQRMWPKPSSSFAKQTLASYPEVADVQFGPSYFSTLNILVSQRSPLGIIGSLAVDNNGIAFPVGAGSALPVLQTDKTYSVGDEVGNEELEALRVMGELSHLSLGPFSSKLQAAVLTITINSDLEIIFDVHNVPNSWADSLQLIFARSKIDAKAPQKIDLRFRDPVVTYK